MQSFFGYRDKAVQFPIELWVLEGSNGDVVERHAFFLPAKKCDEYSTRMWVDNGCRDLERVIDVRDGGDDGRQLTKLVLSS
jgi:hypothetical protein